MSLDPYPDLPDPADGGEQAEPDELSEADSRLLQALSRPQPPVVTAVEDQPRRAVRDDSVAQPSPAGAPLAPVFQEPTG